MKKHYNKILITLLALIILLSSIIFIGPKFKSKYEIWKIEMQNRETMNLISETAKDLENEELNTSNYKFEDELYLEQNEEISLDNSSSNREEKEIPIPTQKYLDVQFICQAPLQTEANWVFHEESCEEAALLMAYNYEMGIEVSKEEANEIILDMIEWQNENFGGHFDIYADQLKEFAVGYYNLKNEQIKVIKNATIEEIKKEITSGHPVVVPITGELLKNPYYPYPGYHMLTVTGFTEDRIITNDNGTRHGEDFSYDIDVFEKAMKDTGGDILILEL